MQTRSMEACPSCGFENPPQFKFCGQCGRQLDAPDKSDPSPLELTRERRHITALFTDLSGYTAMCERLDPEEVKEIMSRIFSDIAKVAGKYEGFVEKFIGDAAMILFGIPKSHEDDPVRAVKAAMEIHDLVETISERFEKDGSEPLSMHSGIDTGLVVTGGVDQERGTYGVTGDTVNLASRLSNMAGPGEILVGHATYRQAEGHFEIEILEVDQVEGKAEQISIYKVLSPRLEPRKVHQVTGFRAELVGRKAEMAKLDESLDRLRTGKEGIVSVNGDAGTGKSRMFEEFKYNIDSEEIQWIEGHAYSYSQNNPYFLITNLLGRAFQIGEGDPPEEVKRKTESGVEYLMGKKDDITPYIGNLFSINYPEIEGMNPDSWKYQLHNSIEKLLSAFILVAPTIICLEDLHWADHSSLNLIRDLMSESRPNVLFLYSCRPPFTLFSRQQLKDLGKSHQDIQLRDLSTLEAQEMVESLLKSDLIPAEIRHFITDKVEGNPLYLEEVINSLIESETLKRINGNWILAQEFSSSDISPTIHGVISARLDRLEKETVKILQEASVIGRAFHYEVLSQVTEFRENLDRCLNELEKLDLIRVKSLEPEVEYIFKHAMTHEVVYNGLLIKDREVAHQKVGLVVEQLYEEKTPEFYEVLSHHFVKGRDTKKAVHYLVGSGEKALSRYALDESHKYFQQAFDLVNELPEIDEEENEILLDIIVKWAPVFHWRAAYGELVHLFQLHEDFVESIGNKPEAGMFYSWLGLALQYREELEAAYQYLLKALKIGEENKSNPIIGYSCTWLTHTCAELGLFDDALNFGKRALEISKLDKLDPILYVSSLRAMGMTYIYRGDCMEIMDIGNVLLEYGQKQSDVRSSAVGHIYVGSSHWVGGDFQTAIECYQRGMQASVDPTFTFSLKLMLGTCHISLKQPKKAEKYFEEIFSFSEGLGSEWHRTIAKGHMGLVLITKGNLRGGIRAAEDVINLYTRINSKWRLAVGNYLLGNVYLQIVQGSGPKSISFLLKNIGFLVRTLPLAKSKAENHFNKTIEVAREIGAKSVLGQASLGLGLLYKSKGKTEQAKTHISEAIEMFEKCEAEMYLKQANEVLASLR
jgi:class 3 adenylate cyclase/tetratricopeptide (TPR) repeat protein